MVEESEEVSEAGVSVVEVVSEVVEVVGSAKTGVVITETDKKRLAKTEPMTNRILFNFSNTLIKQAYLRLCD